MRDRLVRALSSPQGIALLLLASWFLLALGIWGPWISAKPAGLRVLGIDLAEYVKFIAEVRSGETVVMREVYYLPIVALSLSLSLFVHRPELRLPGPVRWVLNILAIPVALSMLPPAWTPPLLRTPEFVKQTIAIGLCCLAALLSYPVLRRLPLPVTAVLGILLALGAALPPLAAFMRLQSAFAVIYGGPISLGVGFWSGLAGALLLVFSAACCLIRPAAKPSRPV